MLPDLQAFADRLAQGAPRLSPNSPKRTLSRVKSIFTFAHNLGYLRFSAAALRAPKAKETLAKRILSEAEVHSMITLTARRRDQLLRRVLYALRARANPAGQRASSPNWASVTG